MVVGVNSQRLWRRFCEALGDPTLVGEAGFETTGWRMKNRDALQARLEAILARDTSASWVLRLEAVEGRAGRAA